MHLDSHSIKTNVGQETAFTAIMGHMDVIEFIAGGFNVYLPIVMCLFCLATFLEVGTRFLHFMGIEQFIVDDEMTADLIKDGSELVKRERNKRTKQLDGRSRWLTGASAREANTSSVRTSTGASNLMGPSTSRTLGESTNDATRNTTVNATGTRNENLLYSSTDTTRIELLDGHSDAIQSYSTIQHHPHHHPNRNIFDDL